MIFGNIISGISYQDRPAAYAVFMDDAGRVAAVKAEGGYFLPGGGSLTGETPEETIAREVGEELARDLRLFEKICEAVQYFPADGRHYKMKAVFYRAAFTGEQQGEAEHDLYWLDEKSVAEGFFHECHKWAVSQVRRRGLGLESLKSPGRQ